MYISVKVYLGREVLSVMVDSCVKLLLGRVMISVNSCTVDQLKETWMCVDCTVSSGLPSVLIMSPATGRISGVSLTRSE